MKKSRIAKFALLGASAAALAATLSTSTYAWYVSNQKADVSLLTGSTNEATTNGSITLSLTGKKGTYYKNITFGNFTKGLNPVYTADGFTFKKLGTAAGTPLTHTEDASTTAITKADLTAAGDYYQLEFYILADKKVTVTPKITITNTTGSAAIPTQVNMADEALSTTMGVSRGQTFAVNALSCLGISQQTNKGTEWTASTANNTAWAENATPVVDKKVQQVPASGNSGAVYVANDTGWTSYSGTVASAGARSYYEQITGIALLPAQKAQATDSAIGDFVLEANTPYKLLYNIYLDGADDLCFNAAAGQTFSFKFDYSATDYVAS